MDGYIPRTIESSVKSLSKAFPVIIICGPRQVGKTTLLNMMFSKNQGKKINYVSLDDLSLRTLAIEDPELFLRTYPIPLIIDEFQYAPNILSYIKLIVDKKRLENLKKGIPETNGLFYLTCSQIFETIKNVTESLAGRVGILDLYGLSSREINGAKEEMFIPDLEILKKKEKIKRLSTSELYQKILVGSYPELYRNKDINRNEYFGMYIKTYLERDIRQIINVQDELKFLKFISNLAARTAQELNMNNICNEIQISNPTGDKWLSILKNTGIIYLLQLYSNNTVARVVKRSKIYFMDTGLSCYLAGYIDSTTLERSAYSGAIFETLKLLSPILIMHLMLQNIYIITVIITKKKLICLL